jgi:putative ABC transport system substrate-binding protein
VPQTSRVAVFVNPANPARAATQVNELQTAARAMGLQTRIFNTSTGREINAAFATFAQERPDALFVSADPFFVVRRIQLANLAAPRPHLSLPARRRGARPGAKYIWPRAIATSPS